MCCDHGGPFIATLQNVLLAPELCDRLFFIITLVSLGHTCLLQKGFCTEYFRAKEEMNLKLPHISQRKYAFLGGNKGKFQRNRNYQLKINCSKLITSRIWSPINQIIIGWR